MPAARCGLCGRLLMLPSPVASTVRCALCEVVSVQEPHRPHDYDAGGADGGSSTNTL